MRIDVASPSSIPTRQVNSHKGMLMMLGGMFCFAGADVLSKVLTEYFHPVQIFWFRQLALLLGVLVMLSLYGKTILHTRRKILQITRGTLVVCSALLFIFAVRHVPLADAVAASFVAPFFLTILGATLLGEKVGMRRWLAVAVGFVGALIIVRPGMNSVHPAVMLVVLAAACYAIRQVLGRLLADTDRSTTTVAYTALTASFIATLTLPFFWLWPETRFQWLALLGVALCGGVGEILVIKALEAAETAVVAPVHYTLIIWGTLYGYLVFDQLPDKWTWIGTAIIVSAGIYTLHRDRLKRTD